MLKIAILAPAGISAVSFSADLAVNWRKIQQLWEFAGRTIARAQPTPGSSGL